jgi:hypothetical protein
VVDVGIQPNGARLRAPADHHVVERVGLSDDLPLVAGSDSDPHAPLDPVFACQHRIDRCFPFVRVADFSQEAQVAHVDAEDRHVIEGAGTGGAQHRTIAANGDYYVRVRGLFAHHTFVPLTELPHVQPFGLQRSGNSLGDWRSLRTCGMREYPHPLDRHPVFLPVIALV